MESNRWTDGLTAKLPKAKKINESAGDREAVRDGARQEVARIANFAIVEKPKVEQPNEATPEIPHQFESQYERLPAAVKSRCTWEELSNRLLSHEAHYLKLAMAMQEGGELVYVDEEGNPVFRDGGVEPVLKGKSYNQTREILYGKDHEEGAAHYGYEMPNAVEELREIEGITGRLFVASEKDRREYRATHMESGENPSLSFDAAFFSLLESVDICDDRDPDSEDSKVGLVRLLRVKKMA